MIIFSIQSNGKQKPVPQKRKGKNTNVKYQTLPDGMYQNPEAETGQPRPAADDGDEEPARYYDCFDRCGK